MMIVDVFQERFSSAFDVGFQELARCRDVSTDTEAEQLVVFGLCPCAAVREGELKPGVAVAFLQQVGHDGQ